MRSRRCKKCRYVAIKGEADGIVEEEAYAWDNFGADSDNSRAEGGGESERAAEESWEFAEEKCKGR